MSVASTLNRNNKGAGSGLFMMIKFILFGVIFVFVAYIVLTVGGITLGGLSSSVALIRANDTAELTECVRDSDGNCRGTQLVTLNTTMYKTTFLKVCAKRGKDGNTFAYCNPPGVTPPNTCGMQLWTYDSRNKLTQTQFLATLVFSGEDWHCKSWDAEALSLNYGTNYITNVKKIKVGITSCSKPNPECAWITEMNASVSGYVQVS